MRTANLNKELLTILHHQCNKTVEEIAALLNTNDATVFSNMRTHKLNIYFDKAPVKAKTHLVEMDGVVATATRTYTKKTPKKTTKAHSTRRSLPNALRKKLLNPDFLQKALSKDGTVSATAKTLGLHSTTLGQYLKKAKVSPNGKRVGRPRTVLTQTLPN